MTWFRRRFDADLHEELRAHVAEREASYVRDGLAPSEARRQARLDFGNPAVIHEQSRDVWLVRWLDNLARDTRIALRMLRRAPGFTFAAVTTLALGIGANAAIFTVADGVLLRALPYPDAERLVRFGDRNADGRPSNMGFETWLDYRDGARTLASTALVRSWSPTLVVDGQAERVPALRVSAGYFATLGVPPAIGRDFRADDDGPDHWRVVLLTDGLWRRRFGADPNIAGRVVRMNDRDYQIIGVLPASFEPPETEPVEMYAALGYAAGEPSACRTCQHLRAIARVREGSTIGEAEAELNAIRSRLVEQFPSSYNAAVRVVLMSFRDVISGPVRLPVLILLGAVVLVLLIACANVASLLVARLMNRDREIALRAALGAGGGRLTAQLLLESAVIAIAGGVSGLALAFLLLSGMSQLAAASLPGLPPISIDGRVLLFTLAVSLLTAVAFGLLPALRASRADLRSAMSVDARTTTGGRQRGRQLLVAIDLALALILLAGAGLMIRSVGQLLTVPAGFDARNVITAQFPLVGQAYAEDAAVRVFQDRLLEQVRALPGVEHAALAGQIPLGGNYDTWGLRIEGRPVPDAEAPDVERFSVTPDYFAAMRIPIVRGRPILSSDTAATEPIIVLAERTADELFPGEDPIGRRVRVGSPERPWLRIVGIAGDVRHRSLEAAPNLQMYLPQAQLTDSFLVMVVRTAHEQPEQLVPAIRGIVRTLDPAVPVHDVATLASLVDKAAGRQRFVMRLLMGFAAIALVLAAVGLYGVISYAVTRRAREVGVRMALGATPADIARLVLGGGSRAIVAGIAGGIAGALLLTSYLEALLYGVEARDPLTFAAAIAVLALVALAAHAIPLRRAMRIEPATALRND